MLTSLQPKTTLELSLAHAIAWDTWRLNHLRAVETNLYALGVENETVIVNSPDPRLHTAIADAAMFAAESQKFALMSIYEQRMNRSLHKNLAILRDLQAERQRHEAAARAEEILLARYSDIEGIPYHAPTKPAANGFVFSNEEILAAANRLTTLKGRRPRRLEISTQGSVRRSRLRFRALQPRPMARKRRRITGSAESQIAAPRYNINSPIPMYLRAIQ